jgi:hypothetical protein
MLYEEIGQGGIGVRGCALVDALHPSVTKFGIGDIVYNVQKARRGVLEKVVIKSVRSVTSRRTLAVGRRIYTDTFNGLWNEWDLVPFNTAMILIATHDQKVLDDLNALAKC